MGKVIWDRREMEERRESRPELFGEDDGVRGGICAATVKGMAVPLCLGLTAGINTVIL